MLLGRLEKDGSRKVGRFFLWSPPLISAVVVVFLLHAFASHLLSCHASLFFFFLCFTFFLRHSFFLLYVGVSVSQTRTETSSTCFDIVPLSSIKKLFTLFHCCLCFQSFLTFFTVPAALWTMWCLRVFSPPHILITVCFIPPTVLTGLSESDCGLHCTLLTTELMTYLISILHSRIILLYILTIWGDYKLQYKIVMCNTTLHPAVSCHLSCDISYKKYIVQETFLCAFTNGHVVQTSK